MISIIVCSINIEYFKGLKKSIENTIGSIEYEIIKIDNLQEKLPITKAYNLGISKSKYNFLVFVHEDVKHLIQGSLAEATRSIQNGDASKVEGIRTWLRKLAEPTTELENTINASKKYRYAV